MSILKWFDSATLQVIEEVLSFSQKSSEQIEELDEWDENLELFLILFWKLKI